LDTLRAMRMLLIQRLGTVALLLSAGLVCSSCSSCKPGKPGPIGKYGINVNLDPSLKDASVAVDVVGVTPLTLPRLDNYSMTSYWQPNDEMRNGADKLTFTLGSGSDSHTVPMTDAKWNEWLSHGVTELVVLADLPGVIDDKAGSLDPRRQELPLDKCNWADGTTNLVINVKRSGLEVSSTARQY
jgi:hypothetical protein